MRGHMIENSEKRQTQIIDYSHRQYQDVDDKDFFVKTLHNERLIDFLPERDFPDSFELDMRNIGDDEDLPDSDRTMDCQTRGISKKDCFS